MFRPKIIEVSRARSEIRLPRDVLRSAGVRREPLARIRWQKSKTYKTVQLMEDRHHGALMGKRCIESWHGVQLGFVVDVHEAFTH